MAPPRPRLMIDSARRMLRHGAYRKVAHLLEGMRPGDAAAFFESIPVADRRRLATLMSRDALVSELGHATPKPADMDEVLRFNRGRSG